VLFLTIKLVYSFRAELTAAATVCKPLWTSRILFILFWLQYEKLFVKQEKRVIAIEYRK